MALLPIIERHLRTRDNLPDSFHFYRWQCFPQTQPTIYYEFEGGICPVLKSGPRKGKPNYGRATDNRKFVVTVEEGKRLMDAYEDETGNCRDCMGECKTVASVSVHTGTTYRACRRCKGSGKSQREAVQA